MLSRSITAAALLCAVMITGCGFSHPTAPPATPDPAPVKTPADAAAPAPAKNDRPLIVAFGDSLTAGLGVPSEDNWPSRLQRRLDDQGYRYRVVNLGVSGDTTAGGMDRFESALALKPQIVILELGANDGLRGLPVGQMQHNLANMIELAQAKGIKVVLAGMQMPPNLGSDYTKPFAAVYATLAQRYKLPLIPFLLDNVAGNPDLNQGDGIHPTAQGYAPVTDNVWKTLQPLLKK